MAVGKLPAEDDDQGEGPPAFPFAVHKVKSPARLHFAAGPRRLHLARRLRFLLSLAGWLAAGAAATALIYQVPVRHTVAIGRNDESYVQGFADAANRWGVFTDSTGATQPYRWSGSESAIIFPQIGLPARATLRWRAWRPPGTPPPRVRVLLNGRDELGSFRATGDWEEHTFAFGGGIWKPRDLFLQLSVEPYWKTAGESRGVQVDRAVLETASWPILPYPAQLLGGALAGLLAALVLRKRPRLAVIAVAGLVLLFLLLYRLQLAPYPVRLFWPIAVGLLACIAVAQRIDWSGPRLTSTSVVAAGFALDAVDLAAVVTVVGTSAALLWASRAHVVLSLPGVEKDFRVFATRSDQLLCPTGSGWQDAGCVLRADGFYQLGYPFLLWLTRPAAAHNPFLAARLVGILATSLFLAGTYWLGRALLGRAGGMIALLCIALNRWTSQYALSLGTDMPFAAAWILALVAIVTHRRNARRAFGAGLLCGLAFIIRHPGIVLLPLGAGVVIWDERNPPGTRTVAPAARRALLGALLLGFLVASLPQLGANLYFTGDLLYSQQAKNIWLAVYGNTDWSRWGQASNDLSLVDVVGQAPVRFIANWWLNVRTFWATGAEDTSEFGRGLALRLLGFPANWLAVGGLFLWLVRGTWRERFLLVVAILYVCSLAVGFMLPRFVVPLLPLWAVAATAAALFVWSEGIGSGRRGARMRQVAVAGSFLVLLLLGGSAQAGVGAVLSAQDPDAAAAVALIGRTLAPGERLVSKLPTGDSLDKYSAVAHLVVPENIPAARYILDSGAQPVGTRLAGQAGRYRIYRLTR